MASEKLDEKAIFNIARQIKSPEARAAYLLQICEADGDLRRRVNTLLQAYEEQASFLESPPAAGFTPTQAQSPAETPGTQIGPYKLLQQIGEGGMGTVYMAEQTHPVQRKVALKVIKAGMDSRPIIARFEAERQALAMMDHVNIARVLDAGTIGAKDEGGRMKDERGEGAASDSSFIPQPSSFGRPYFVMELVHGVPITKYCDDNHLSPRERLELFVPVCQAIQHAHQKGIIHRDIKPSNVMVTLYDGKPVPKVIDFGVAKATEQKLTERTLFTQYGSMVGTLEYMSPEQAEMIALGVDTRSDIYSLGVLLYELLTGSTPLTHQRMKEAAYAEILRMIKEEEPPKPSTRLSDSGEALASISANRHTEPAKLTKLVRGELDWIVMKTLEKDRNRRYETAKDFAADVQRYLDDEQVQACPPSAGYRFRKFARRNKTVLAFIGLVLLIVLTLTGGIGWNVRDRAAREEEFARERAMKQTAVEIEVSLALKEAEQWQEQEKWPEALSAAKRAEGLMAGGGSDELRDQVRQLRKDLEMVLRLEEVRLLSSESKDNQWDWQGADRGYAQAFGDYGIDVLRLPVEDAAPRIRARAGMAVPLAVALDEWARVRGAKDRPALTALAHATDPDPWRRQVREAVKQKETKALAALAASPELLRQPPTSLLVLARALRSGGLAEAEIEVLRKAQRQHPGDFWINYHLGWALGQMGPPYGDEAISFYRAALAVRPQSSAAHDSLGCALKGPGKQDEGIACHRKAIELDPKNARAHYHLGIDLKEQGKLDDAIACYRRAIELDPKYASAHYNLGIASKAQGKVDQAIDCYRKAIELDPKHVNAHVALGNALVDQNKLDEAIDAYRKAIELNPKHVNAHVALGNALRTDGNLDEAVASYRKAIELDPTYAEAYTNLGALLCDHLKNYGKAIECFRKAIELDPKQHAKAYYNLGIALEHQKKVDEAIDAYRKAIEVDPKYPKAHYSLGVILCDDLRDYENAAACFRTAIELDPKDAFAHSNLGIALKAQGKLDEAIACHRRAIEIDPKYAFAHNILGNALKAQGNLDEAIACHRRAIELDAKYADAHHGLGIALKAQGKLDEAIAAYRTAIELNPKDAKLHVNLGNALKSQGKVDEAIDCYRKAIEIDPKLANAHHSLGNALTSQGKVEEAIACYRKAIELDPKLAHAHDNLGAILCDVLHDYEGAAACFRKAIEFNPKNANAHCNLGNALLRQEKLDDAIAVYRTAIELDPKFVFAHNNLGTALQTQGKLDEAIAAYLRAIELNPKHDDAHSNLGNALASQGKVDEAIAAYLRAIEINPKSAKARYNLGNALFDQNKLDDAIAAYCKAIEIDPKYCSAYINLASVLKDQAKLDEAIVYLHRAIELDPKDADARYYLGNTLNAQGKLDEAIASYRKAIELDPKYVSAHYRLALALQAHGKWDDAIAAHSKAIELDPKLAGAWNGRGWVHQQLHQLDKALADLTKGIELDPKDAWGWSARSETHLKLGQLDKAIADSSRAIELDPKYAFAWFNRGKAHQRLEQPEKAISDYRTAIELDSKFALCHNNLAWLLATWPEAKFRDPKRAVELAKKAVDLDPKTETGSYWNTLGAAHYRAGSWRDAVAALEKSMELRQGGNSFDWIFLAMAHWQLGEKDKAREWYDRAVEWMEKNAKDNEELQRFRKEALELIESEKKTD